MMLLRLLNNAHYVGDLQGDLLAFHVCFFFLRIFMGYMKS